jgi:ABC-type branched-subunit amino acid transport system substrate-binding protein
VVAAYHTACADLIREEQVDHIVGCYTSASRKQVIPIVERTERLLWHPARYEGFESSDNVIYVGAAPNQHVVPLVRHMLDHISHDVFCVGSNYVWTWETNRVIREIVTSAGGRILAERCWSSANPRWTISSRRSSTASRRCVQYAGRGIQLRLHARAARGHARAGSRFPC